MKSHVLNYLAKVNPIWNFGRWDQAIVNELLRDGELMPACNLVWQRHEHRLILEIINEPTTA